MKNILFPNLIIGGLPKSGTTFLFNLLSQHSDVFPSKVKEISMYMSFVRENKKPNLHRYLDYFKHYNSQKYLLEASPHYFNNGKSIATHIKNDIRNLKLIFCFRNPVDHLFSLYKGSLRNMRITKNTTFEYYLKNRKFYPGLNKTQLLKYWVDIFNKENIKVVFFENLIEKNNEEFLSILDWLELKNEITENLKIKNINKGGIPKNLWLQKVIKSTLGSQTKEYIPHKLEIFLRGMMSINMHEIKKNDIITKDVISEINSIYCTSDTEFLTYLKNIGYSKLPKWLYGNY